jgi:hypothetical protein
MFRTPGIVTVALLASLFALPALAGNDFLVSKRKHPQLGDVTTITITSQQDAVIVTGIKVNRGNCPLANNYNTPINGEAVGQIRMKYGTEFTIFARGFCNPLELELKTDNGVFKTSWDK